MCECQQCQRCGSALRPKNKVLSVKIESDHDGDITATFTRGCCTDNATSYREYMIHTRERGDRLDKAADFGQPDKLSLLEPPIVHTFVCRLKVLYRRKRGF